MRQREHGAALVLVLWLVALLTAVVGAFALSARVEALQGKVLGDSVLLQERARAGLEYGLTRLQGTPLRPGWRPDGRRYRWQFDGSVIDIRIVDESGKIDLNVADAALLTALLRAIGVDQERAPRLAGAIVDWRDRDSLSQPGGGAEDGDYASAGLPYGAKDARFESLGELRLVLGMDAELYRQLLPNVSLHSRRSRPDPAFAPGPVLSAMGLDAQTLLAQREGRGTLQQADGSPGGIAASGTGTYSVESRARQGDGREAVLRVVVRVGPSPLPGAAYTVLRWDEGATAR